MALGKPSRIELKGPLGFGGACKGLGEGKMRSQRLLTSCYCIGAVDLSSTSCCSRIDCQAVRGIQEQESGGDGRIIEPYEWKGEGGENS